MLKNHYLLGLDSMQNTIETTYLAQWLPQSKLNDRRRMAERLAAVTPKDVQNVAKNSSSSDLLLDGGRQNG